MFSKKEEEFLEMIDDDFTKILQTVGREDLELLGRHMEENPELNETCGGYAAMIRQMTCLVNMGMMDKEWATIIAKLMAAYLGKVYSLGIKRGKMEVELERIYNRED